MQQLRGGCWCAPGQDVQERLRARTGRCSQGARGPVEPKAEGKLDGGGVPAWEIPACQMSAGQRDNSEGRPGGTCPSLALSARPRSPESCCEQTQSYQEGQEVLEVADTPWKGKAVGGSHGSRAQLQSPHLQRPSGGGLA